VRKRKKSKSSPPPLPVEPAKEQEREKGIFKKAFSTDADAAAPIGEDISSELLANVPPPKSDE
jgi:hypothetical protein